MGFLGLNLGKDGVPPALLLGLSVFFLLPVVQPALFGWLNGFSAAPLLYVLLTYGYSTGLSATRISLLFVGIAALLMQRMDIYLFTLTFVPLGFVLFSSARNKEAAAISGAKGLLTLGVSWLIFWTGYGVISGTNPYTLLIKALDLGFQQTLDVYNSKDAGLSPEMVYHLQIMTNSLREIVPRLMPGLLATAVLLAVWLNMVLGNRFVARHTHAAPWGTYETWKLPDQLVWAPIAAIFTILVGQGLLKDLGFCLLLVSGVIYLLQGLAVFFALLKRWNVPSFARFLLYGILLIQSYSLLLLALLGLCDIWFNLRHKSNER
ncbi:MAG: DUF2232 domain-containing protein [Desulfobulbus sp.]|nr:DUF2232 domain-containing protein [Desulfobulbus sp.]